MKKPPMVTNNICELREARGLSQAGFSHRIRVTRQTLIAIENGHYSPPLELALEIAHAFGVGVEDVFHSPEEMK
jgi:putative transcriptional regulator